MTKSSPFPTLDAIRARPADRRLARTLDAHGGDAFVTLTTLRLRGTGTFHTPPQMGRLAVPLPSVALSFGLNGCLRLDALSLGGRLAIINRGDGQGGAMLIGQRQFALPATHVDGIEPLGLLRAAVLENAAVNDVAGETNAFDIVRAGQPTARVATDATTFLLTKTVTRTARGEMCVLLSGYFSVDDLPIPGTIQLLEDDSNVLTLQIDRAELNPTLPESLFRSTT